MISEKDYNIISSFDVLAQEKSYDIVKSQPDEVNLDSCRLTVYHVTWKIYSLLSQICYHPRVKANCVSSNKSEMV